MLRHKVKTLTCLLQIHNLTQQQKLYHTAVATYEHIFLGGFMLECMVPSVVQRRYQRYGLNTPIDAHIPADGCTTTLLQNDVAAPVIAENTSKSVLTVNMLYSIVTLTWGEDGTSDAVMYHAATNSVMTFMYNDKSSLEGVAQWLRRCCDAVAQNVNTHAKVAAAKAGITYSGDDVHTIVYPAHPVTRGSAIEKSLLMKQLQDDTKIIMDRSVWELVRGMFNNQQQVVKAARLPPSLEHAFLDLNGKRYDCLYKASLSNASTSISGGKIATKGTLEILNEVNRPTPIRLAVLSWDAMVKCFQRFGTEGGKKNFTPEEHMIRNAVKIVNVFVVSCDNKIQSGTVRNGITYASEVYSCQTKRSTMTQFRSFQDQGKRTLLTTLLFGEGQNTLTLLIPSHNTKIHQVQFFARMCKPKCPYMIADMQMIAKYLPDGINLGASAEIDPKRYWNDLIKALPGTDEERHIELVKAASAFALTASVKRHDFNAIVLSAATGRGVLVYPMTERDAFTEVSKLTGTPVQTGTVNAVSDPVTEATATVSSLTPVKKFVDTFSQVFVNKVNLRDIAPAQALDEWRKRIYFNEDRAKREIAAAEGLKRYLIVDLETTTGKRYKRIANPFTKENWVVLSGAKDYKGKVFMNEEYFEKEVSQNYDNLDVIKRNGQNVKGSSSRSLFLPPLDNYDVIVGHNVKFDLLQLWRDRELRAFFTRGGRIWDTMYGEYLLSGHQVRLGRGAGLEDVARSYGGRTPKLDEVKQAWANGKNTYEIPPVILKEYLHGDLNNTELIFKKHIAKAVEQRQVIIAQCRMDGLLCTTEMEYNGLRVDMKVAIDQANELNDKAASLEKMSKMLIPKEIPPRMYKHWNWASNQHLGLYLFGGQLGITTNSYLSNKPLPRCSWGRHNIWDSSAMEVNLGPPNIITAPAECSILCGGFASDKATKVAKSYLLPYVTEAGFRKSSPWMESFSATMKALKRGKIDAKNSEVGPLINLMPKRYLLYTVAAEIDTVTQLTESLTFYNLITKETITFNLKDNNVTETVKNMEQYLLEQCRIHTCKIIDDNNVHIHVFKPAQVLFITRDASVMFSSLMERDSRLSSFVDKYFNNRTHYDDDWPEMTISPVDAYSALEWFRQYTTVPSKVPAELQPGSRNNKGEPFITDIHLLAAEWCQKYAKLIIAAAHITFFEEDIIAKKLTKKQREARQKDESSMPLLMRPVATLRETLPKEWEASEVQRYEILYFFGKMSGTHFDAFYTVGYPKTIEVTIPGVLQKYVPEKGAAISIMEKFRSPQTHALQVGTDTLSYFEKTHDDPVAKTIINLRGMQKLIGTYYEFSEGGTGMVSLVHDSDSCIHHELLHTKTNTGRLASANPNCQNIPKEDKSPLREMFVSRFHNGICIEVDYSQLEVITLAALANDKEMIKDLQNNVDFHCKRVTMMRPDLEYSEVLLRAKKNKEPEFVKMRQQAKIFSFQRQYGAGVRMLSESTGLTQDQIKSLIERERAIYKDCDTFSSMVTLSANTYDPTIQDGVHNTDGQLLYKGMFPVITGTQYIFSESDLPAVVQGNLNDWEKRTNFSPTHLKNYPVQGFAGEIVQIMLGRLWRHFVKNNNYGGKALLTNTVHDCVWVDTMPEVTAQVAKDVESIMSSVKTVLNGLWPEMACVLEFPVDVVAGENMGHLRPLKELNEIFKAQKERDEKKVMNK